MTALPPPDLPIFPLSGALLLPRGILPLNIFEPRYVAMVEAALATPHRLIGMIQPRAGGEEAPLYPIGCAGRITSFSETGDGRYLITLLGQSRFRVTQELDLAPGGFRRVSADWADFGEDRQDCCLPVLDRGRLMPGLQSYFEHQGLSADWSVIADTPDDRLVTCLSMICPFAPEEKQALLEAHSPRERARVLETLIAMAGCDPCHGKCH